MINFTLKSPFSQLIKLNWVQYPTYIDISTSVIWFILPFFSYRKNYIGQCIDILLTVMKEGTLLGVPVLLVRPSSDIQTTIGPKSLQSQDLKVIPGSAFKSSLLAPCVQSATSFMLKPWDSAKKFLSHENSKQRHREAHG